MARTKLTKDNAPGSYGHTGQKLGYTAADAVNQNCFIAGGNDLVIAKNPDTSAHTVTINSVADQYGRTKDIDSYSIPAGETHVFGPFSRHGWESDGQILLEANSNQIKFAILKL